MIYVKSKAKDIIADKTRIKNVVAETISSMATIVGATLGPGGRGVLIEREGLAPIVTKDGVTVARHLGTANADANIIIDAAKEICLNTGKEAGDGTTSAIILADALIQAGHSFLGSHLKYNPQRLVNELKECYDTLVVPYLKTYAVKAETEEQLRKVATISANGDAAIAEAVVKAVMAAGEDGTVLVEEAQGNQLRVETIDGYIVTTGLKEFGQIGPVFINDKAGQQCKLDNGLVFLYDGSMNDLVVPSAIQGAVERTPLFGLPIIVIAHAFSDTVLDAFAKNFKGGVAVVPVKTPMSGLPNSSSLFLQDMAAYTGAMVVDPGNLSEFDDEGFGNFLDAKINMYETVITSSSSPAAIEARITEFDKMHIRAMIGKLTEGISTIWVGGASDLEVREKKARVEDAIEAVRSAIAEGVVPGGCTVHLTLSKMIDDSPDAKPAWRIMSDALQAPLAQLLHNCGEEVNEIRPLLMEGIGSDKLPSIVFDANQHLAVDPFEAGILEPAKVIRVSLGNALSVASLLITLGGIVVSPRDTTLENQMELSKSAMRDMMDSMKGQ